jgi:hypothetical protein
MDGTDKGLWGPALKLTKADNVKFLFYWAEWISPTGLGSNAVLPVTSGANMHLGDYATADGVFFNPASILTDAGGTWT